LRAVKLDAEVLVRAPRVVACGQHKAPLRLATLAVANDGRQRGSGDPSVAADPQLANAIGGRNPNDDLDGVFGEVAAVTADNNGGQVHGVALQEGIECALHEVVREARLGEHRNLLAQPTRPRFLFEVL